MRLTIAFVCGLIWCAVMALAMSETGITVSNDVQVLTLAIVVAGALAGGD